MLWGAATGDTSLRDLGSYLLTTESEAITQYWFDANEQVFPASYRYGTVGMVWGSGAAYSTWWTANPEEIHGINVLPVTGGSLHLAREKAAIARNIAEMERENGGPAQEWRDLLWEFEALTDPARAKAKWDGVNGNYTPEQGESKAHTYHWISTLDTLGAPDMTVSGDLPTSAVFSKNGTRTYTAHNHGSTTRTVTFSDGKTLSVPARSTATGTGADTGNPDPEEPGPSTGNTFRLKSGGILTTSTTDPAGADTVASADGVNRDGTPYRPTVYEVKQVNGQVAAGAGTTFRLRVDAGTKVALAPQVRVSYDLTGDGTFDRTETYRYFATDPVAGWEEYTQAVGAQAVTGSLGELKNGTVRLEIWNALGNGTSQVQTGTDAAVLKIPYA